VLMSMVGNDVFVSFVGPIGWYELTM
jgi:hypothetical protein